MANWKCSVCNVAVEEVDDIMLRFNEIEMPSGVGFRCPVCGAEWLDGDYVVDELAAAEEMLEGK
jgi:rubredoxin